MNRADKALMSIQKEKHSKDSKCTVDAILDKKAMKPRNKQND